MVRVLSIVIDVHFKEIRRRDPKNEVRKAASSTDVRLRRKGNRSTGNKGEVDDMQSAELHARFKPMQRRLKPLGNKRLNLPQGSGASASRIQIQYGGNGVLRHVRAARLKKVTS